jgi:excisionase family DNA binding protein
MSEASSAPALQALLTARQTAKILNICDRKLWELTNSKQIPHVRFGKAIRYDPHDLQAWLDEKKKEALR